MVRTVDLQVAGEWQLEGWPPSALSNADMTRLVYEYGVPGNEVWCFDLSARWRTALYPRLAVTMFAISNISPAKSASLPMSQLPISNINLVFP